jgi:hypothetical protein
MAKARLHEFTKRGRPCDGKWVTAYIRAPGPAGQRGWRKIGEVCLACGEFDFQPSLEAQLAARRPK